MRKGILLLGGAGIAAGLAIALTATKKKNGRLTKAEEGEGASDDYVGQNEDRTRSSEPQDEASSMKNLSAESESSAGVGEIEIDDRGTNQQTASAILERVRDNAFDASDEKLALALGRPTEEVTGWLDGSETIDGDVLLKVRALAMERGVEVSAAPASN